MKFRSTTKKLSPVLLKNISEVLDKQQPFKEKVEEAKAFLAVHPLPKELFF
jgi:hypothetical protein